MPPSPIPCLLAVDGGGSTCRAAVSLSGQVFTATSGPANVCTDLEGALHSIATAIDEAAARAGLERAALARAPAYLGLAGVMGRQEGARIADRLKLERAQVEDDRPAAIFGALGDADGTVAGIGTGSFVGRRVEWRLRLVGGWGFRLGDEASAAWLGRALLVSTLRTIDGMATPSPVTHAVLRRYGDAAGIVAFASGADAQDLGRLAPIVTHAAEHGDATARALMREGAAYIEAALAALGWRPAEPLCLIGGVAGAYAPYLHGRAAAALRPPQGTGLDGALMLAARLAGRIGEDGR